MLIKTTIWNWLSWTDVLSWSVAVVKWLILTPNAVADVVRLIFWCWSTCSWVGWCSMAAWSPMRIFPGRNRGYNGYGERGARAYNGIWGRSTQRGPGADPMVRGSGGQAPCSWKLWSICTPKGRPKTSLSIRQNCLIWHWRRLIQNMPGCRDDGITTQTPGQYYGQRRRDSRFVSILLFQRGWWLAFYLCFSFILLSFVETVLARLQIVLKKACGAGYWIDGCLLSRLQQCGNVVPVWL